MKKITTIPEIAPDPRLVAAYDKLASEVEAMLEEIRLELRGGGYEGTDAEVLGAALTEGWLEGVERAKLASVEAPARGLLEGVALAKVAPLAARLEEIRKSIAGAIVQYDGVIYPLWLKYNDLVNVKGVLRLKPSRRERFIDDMTRRLTEEEVAAYREFYDIIPRLKSLKGKGWVIWRIVEQFVGRFDFQNGVDLNDLELAKAVCRYHLTTQNN